MKFEPQVWVAIGAACLTVVLGITLKMWDAIAPHVGNPLGVGRLVKELGRKVQLLGEKQRDLRCWDPIPSSEECSGWLKRVNDLQEKQENLKRRFDECGALSYLASMGQIGKKIQTEIKKANDLISQSERLLTQAKASPPRLGIVPKEDQPAPGTFPGMEGSHTKVLDFIKDNHADSALLGVWGMAGVGKTTLMKWVLDSRSEYDDYFSVVLFVHVGKGCATVAHLQKSISIGMRIDQIDNETSQSGNIRRHLQDKNFLVIVDDLWEYINLDDIGIPSLKPGRAQNIPRRKVVFTTRTEDVCSRMQFPDNKKTIQMKCLNQKDAWDLFAGKVGCTTLEDPEICDLAKKIVEDCGGLPMALCSIGDFMKPKQNGMEWRDAVRRLDPRILHTDLLKCLQESYNIMDDKQKELFLVCSLWPENESISMKELIRWWTGLGLLDEYADTCDTGYSFIKNLVRASMLQESNTSLDSTDSHVKIHKMNRKMAIWIVNEHNYKWLLNSLDRSALTKEMCDTVEKAWVSQQDTSFLNGLEDTSRWWRWSSKIYFPRLKMLVARHLSLLILMIYHFKMITFLDLVGMRRDLEGTEVNLFPVEICKLMELQHLNLSATTIDALPLDLKNLFNLKYLYIRNNMDLKTIPEGVILALQKLRRLDLFCTGASFPEVLEELASSDINLDMLGFTVRTTEEIIQLGQLERVSTQALCMHHVEDETHPDIIDLQLLSNLKELRELAIVTSSDNQIKELVATTGPTGDWLFPHLETFELNNLLKLEKVTWENAGKDIRVISIYKCDKLKDVTWVRHLKYLEQLTVVQCKEMEILMNFLDATKPIRFRLLQKLKLEDLPKLSMISQQACEFEELSYICVTRCNEMKGIGNHKYKQSMITIDCSENWWNRDSSGRSNPFLVPAFCS